jgi:type IV secretory pathway TrbD component
MSTDRPRELPIQQSANRPSQILGCDRELLLCALLAAVLLGFGLSTWWGMLLAVAFWFGSLGILSRMGKADVMMRQVYWRHLRYAAFYPAKAGLYSQPVETPHLWR